MQFFHPYYLLALLLIPVAVWLFVRYRKWREKALQKFGESSLVSKLISGNSKWLAWLKFLLPIFAFIFIVAGLADLRYGAANRTVHHEGIDLVILLDVSNSMLATDVTPNRLDAAKAFARELVQQMPDARIALITFAAIPVLQTPLTIDHGAVQLLLDAAGVNDIPEQGSDLGAALSEGLHALPQNLQHYRVMVLISDGEDQEGNLQPVIQDVRENQVAVCTVGVGSEQGASIPIVMDGAVSRKKDAAGNTVITRFTPATLRAIAQNSNGIFGKWPSPGNKTLQEVTNRLDAINKNRFDEQLLVQYESRFQWFLLPALALLIIDLLIGNKKVSWFRKRKKQ